MKITEQFFEEILKISEQSLKEENSDLYFTFLKNTFENPSKRRDYLQGDGKKTPETYADVDKDPENYNKRAEERYYNQISRADINARIDYFEGDNLDVFKTDINQLLDNYNSDEVPPIFKGVMKDFANTYCDVVDKHERNGDIAYYQPQQNQHN